MQKIVFFDGGFLQSDFSFEDDVVVTGGLILVEGTHRDSNRKVHTFSKERLQEIARNSNTLFDEGQTIPLLDNHTKTTAATLGAVEAPFRLEVITEDNLPNKRAKHLLGKLGLFADQVVVKSSDAIEKVKRNIVKTVSPGLDIVSNMIRELSLTPTPAIAGLSLYSGEVDPDQQPRLPGQTGSPTLTFDDLEQSNDDLEQVQLQYQDLCDKLWMILMCIFDCDQDQMEINKEELIMKALSDWGDRVLNLIGMSQDDQIQEDSNDPRLMQRQGGNPNLGPSGYAAQVQQQQSPFKQTNYSKNQVPLAVFSIAEMEAAEFGIGEQIGKIGEHIGEHVGRAREQVGRVWKGAKHDVESSINVGKKSRDKISNRLSNTAHRNYNNARMKSIIEGKELEPRLMPKDVDKKAGVPRKATMHGVRKGAKHLMKTNTGKIGAGVLGVAGAGAVGLGAYHALKPKKDQRLAQYR